jgi:hypothetical protein
LWRGFLFDLWLAKQSVRVTGQLRHIFLPLTRLAQALFDRFCRLEGRLYQMGPRHEIKLNWRHWGTPLLVLALLPLVLIAIPVSRVHLWHLQRRRRRQQ